MALFLTTNFAGYLFQSFTIWGKVLLQYSSIVNLSELKEIKKMSSYFVLGIINQALKAFKERIQKYLDDQ